MSYIIVSLDSPPAVYPRAAFIAQLETRYPKLLGAQAERESASAKRLSKQGAFDPSLSASVQTQRFNSSASRGKAQTGSGTVLEIEGASPQGLKYRVGRIENDGAVKSPLSSTGSGGTYFAEVKLPLLRGAGLNEKSVALQQARLGESSASLALSTLRQNALFDGATAYVKWAGAGRKQEVISRLLTLAEMRLKGIREEVRLRQRARIEETEAEAEVALRRERLAQAERGLDEARLKLEKFVWDETRLAERSAEPLARPAPVTEPEAAEALRQALERRPEPQALGLERAALRLSEGLARNDRRWQLDLVFAPGRDLGAAGIGNTLKAGIAASLPLNGQREARGREDEARLKGVKLEQERVLLERTISLEVRDAVSAVNRARERFLAAEESLRRTREVEAGEQMLFRAGVGTLFLVNQRERATAEAESRLIDAQVEAEQARLILLAVTMQL